MGRRIEKATAGALTREGDEEWWVVEGVSGGCDCGLGGGLSEECEEIGCLRRCG